MMITAQKRKKALLSHINRMTDKIASLEQKSQNLSMVRLVIFLLGGGLTILALYWASELISGVFALLAIAVFAAVAVYHRRIDAGLKNARVWVEIKQQHFARMNLDWHKLPQARQIQVQKEHPFHPDLQVVGPYSLHHLIDTATSRQGSQMLADWLLHPDLNRDTILQRQELVAELKPLSRFRDKLQLACKRNSEKTLDSRQLLDWLQSVEKPKLLSGITVLLSVLAICNITLFSLSQFAGWANFWLYSFIPYALIYYFYQKPTKPLLEEATFLEDEIKPLKSALSFIENYPLPNQPLLEKHCAPIRSGRVKPSRKLGQVRWVASLVGLRMNPLMALLLNIFIPWDYYCALLLHRVKMMFKAVLPKWYASFSGLEALCSLANFAHFFPSAKNPVILHNPANKTPLLKAQTLWHPLINFEDVIANDVSFSELGEIALITGSNMSGKSTFLKTIGINACLAYAGAPVCAQSMHIGLFQLFTSLRVDDSIIEGISFFYAEVRRLKKLLDLCDQTSGTPVLFLVDEIFRGTNNRERLIGSKSLVRALTGKNGLGCVSTHDLELVHLEEEISHVINYHFREHVENGEMHFDYKLYKGPCPTTNALKIMQAAGLPVNIA